MKIEELIALEAKASEQNKDAPLQPDTTITRGHPRAKTLQIRLTEDEFTALADLAEHKGLPVSTFARDLLRPHLEKPEPLETSISKIRQTLDILANRAS